MELKIWLIIRNNEVKYKEYDSAVVISATAESALNKLKENYGTGDFNG